MGKFIKKFAALLLICMMMLPMPVYAKKQTEETGNTENHTGPVVTSQSAVLMEVETGTVVFEQNASTRVSPASITKIMTLILIAKQLDEGKIKLTDTVTVSEFAQSMGGSQVFLEAGEQQSVETMIKCIVVASGNDASVAMAEYISGTESAFVGEMNAMSATLGLTDTHFEDCCGLTDSDNHYTSAKDVAVMSAYLLKRAPWISEYTTIWMENIIHTTDKGSSEFGLANTNKLLKMSTSFEVTGLKTGSTKKAGYCLSASGEKDGIAMVAVVMDAPDYKVRFSEAKQLLDYGFANCQRYEDTAPPEPGMLRVLQGKEDEVALEYAENFVFVDFEKRNLDGIVPKLQLDASVTAPFEKGTKVGMLIYSLEGEEIGQIDVMTSSAGEKAGFTDILRKIYRYFINL